MPVGGQQKDRVSSKRGTRTTCVSDQNSILPPLPLAPAQRALDEGNADCLQPGHLICCAFVLSCGRGSLSSGGWWWSRWLACVHCCCSTTAASVSLPAAALVCRTVKQISPVSMLRGGRLCWPRARNGWLFTGLLESGQAGCASRPTPMPWCAHAPHQARSEFRLCAHGGSWVCAAQGPQKISTIRL